MDEFEKKKRRKIILASILSAVLIAGVVLALLLFYLNGLKKDKSTELSLPENVSPFVVEKADESGDKLAEGDQKDVADEIAGQGGVLSSENFQIKDVKFGGAIASANGSDESVALEINEIKGETVSSPKGKNNKVLITWKTNKLAVSTVEYSKSGAAAAMKFTETDYGFNHALVLSGLECGTRYTYSIRGKDRWGNEKKSEKFAVYMGERADSILDIIAKEFNGIFGWAMKK